MFKAIKKTLRKKKENKNEVAPEMADLPSAARVQLTNLTLKNVIAKNYPAGSRQVTSKIGTLATYIDGVPEHHEAFNEFGASLLDDIKSKSGVADLIEKINAFSEHVGLEEYDY